MQHGRPRRILPAIVFSQFAGTSLWFAGNAVLPDLQRELGLGPDALATITSAVQMGFIAGTLVFALANLADRFSPRAVFLASAILGAVANGAIVLLARDASAYAPLLALRFATGFCLAGIYPVGMKIAASWYREGLGGALGYLVGALVLGTAFPHLIKGLGHGFPPSRSRAARSCRRSCPTARTIPAEPASTRARSWASSPRGTCAPPPSATSGTCGSSTPSGRWCRS